MEFFDDTSGADLGAGVLQNSGAGTSTWALTTSATELKVTGGAQTIRAAYTATGSFVSSFGILSGGESITKATLTVTADGAAIDYVVTTSGVSNLRR